MNLFKLLTTSIKVDMFHIIRDYCIYIANLSNLFKYSTKTAIIFTLNNDKSIIISTIISTIICYRIFSITTNFIISF